MIIGVIYRHHKNNISQFIDVMDNTLSQLNDNNVDICLMEDFNINLEIDKRQPSTWQNLNMLASNGFIPITQPTRVTMSSHTIIDNII